VLLDAVASARTMAEVEGVRSATQLRTAAPDAFGESVARITGQLVKYPLALLQPIGEGTPDFLFRSWPAERSVSRVARDQGAVEPMIHWLPGAAAALVRYAALVRPLIEVELVRDVARWNGLDTEEERLRAHPFGATRAGAAQRPLPPRQRRETRGGTVIP
jgi:hypothetical protein